ncbi:MAG: hypothetical protein WCH44_01550 [Betaproteobacteria bacterium]
MTTHPNPCPDYFAPAATPLERVLRRVKRRCRRKLIVNHARVDAFEGIPALDG